MGLIFPFVFDLVDFCLARSARRGGVLELLLTAPEWRADGSVTAATAVARESWQRRLGILS